MKKKLLFGFIFGASSFIHAQVVMENHLPPFGASYSLNNITTSIAIPTAGANQTWDYSAITTTPVTSFTVVDPATLPSKIKDSVPGTTYATRVEIGGSPDVAPYDFILNKTTHYVKIGTKSSGSNPPEKKSDTIMMFNQGFGDTLTYGTGNVRVLYAGYGTLKAMTKVYQNVVMLKSFTSTTSNVAYQFYQFSPYFQQLFMVSTRSDTVVTKYYFEPTSAPNGLREENILHASVYPNPVNDILNIQFDKPSTKAKIEIMDMQGKSLLQQFFDQTQNIHTDLSGFEPGIYFLNLQSDGTITTRKLIVY